MRNLIFIFAAKYLYIVVIIVPFFWFLRQSKAKQKEALMLICIALPLIYIAAEIAGLLYHNPRPFVLGNFQPLIPHKVDNGFPSHHTLLVSALSAAIFPFSRCLSFILWVLVLFVGISRVYVGVHHAIDIIASIAISIIIVSLVNFFNKRMRARAAK